MEQDNNGLVTGEKKKKTGREATQFKPHQSGNPKGRPKKTEKQIETEKKVEECSNDVLAMMAGDLPYISVKIKGLIDDPMTPASVKVRIWVEYMDRIYGKAFQAEHVEQTDNQATGVIYMPAREGEK